jgi:hypothetical protein
VCSLVGEQSGPARILTISASTYDSNLMIGQDGTDFVLRLRTPWTDHVGTIGGEPVARLPVLFRTPASVELRIIVEPGRLRIVAGAEPPVERSLPPLPLASWDPAQRLALGNEVTYNRPWLGEVRRTVVSSGDRTMDHAETRRLEFPPAFVITAEFPKLVPFRPLNARDAVLNVIMYVPLGFLLALLLGTGRGRRPSHVAWALSSPWAAVSASMEALQILVPRRFPSIDDLIFNTPGRQPRHRARPLGPALARAARSARSAIPGSRSPGPVLQPWPSPLCTPGLGPGIRTGCPAQGRARQRTDLSGATSYGLKAPAPLPARRSHRAEPISPISRSASRAQCRASSWKCQGSSSMSTVPS